MAPLLGLEAGEGASKADSGGRSGDISVLKETTIWGADRMKGKRIKDTKGGDNGKADLRLSPRWEEAMGNFTSTQFLTGHAVMQERSQLRAFKTGFCPFHTIHHKGEGGGFSRTELQTSPSPPQNSMPGQTGEI